MRRLVVVSNRLPPAVDAGREEARDLAVGGLASALLGALRRAPDCLWLGWNGREGARRGRPAQRVVDGVRVAGIALSERELDGYYRGACNSALWPLCHGFQGRVRLDAAEMACYRDVNAAFARALRPLLEAGDLVWVHDYQLFELARELRRLGWSGRVGFFLHVPFPALDLWQLLPDPAGLLEAVAAYDVVGFQTQDHLDNYVHCCRRLLGAAWDGRHLRTGRRRQLAGVFPVGVDPEGIAAAARAGAAAPAVGGKLKRVVRGRKLLFGVDRLDYTKGLPERLLAFELLVRRHPRWRKHVSFIQVAAPSRSRVPEYVEHRRLVESLVGRLNGDLAEHDWVPIRYLHRSYRPAQLAGFYREADACVVTPLRDGMNLVAKEFVAAQDAEDPGVLILSRFAGAAAELDAAVLVNPYLPSDSAAGMRRALEMPLLERRERHAALLAHVRARTASWWATSFVETLERGVLPADPAGDVARRSDRAGPPLRASSDFDS
jgi:trehalose 6-phosphate synthase